MSEIDIYQKLTEIEEAPRFSMIFGESSDRTDRISEHRLWLQNIRKEHPLPATPYRVGVYHNDIILEVCDHYGLQYQNPTLFFLQSNRNDHACIVRDCNTYSTCSLGLLFYNHKRLLFTSKNKKGRCLKKFSNIAQII